MARRTSPSKKGPDWPTEKTLSVLRDQLRQLQAFKGTSYSTFEIEEREWEEFTRGAIIHGFGEDSENIHNFYNARSAGIRTLSVGGMPPRQRQDNFEKRIAQYEATLRSSIRELEIMLVPSIPPSSNAPRPVMLSVDVNEGMSASPVAGTNEPPLILISHSSKDVELATALVEFLRAGLLINRIRCSSVDGYRLPAGVKTEDQLRREVSTAGILIGLITPNSLASAYVMFELGARWGAGGPMIPLLAGVTPAEIHGPLNSLNHLSGNNDSQLHQLLGDIANALKIPVQRAESYVARLASVRIKAGEVANVAQPASSPGKAVDIQEDFSVSLMVVGMPPAPQVLRVRTGRPVMPTRLEYLLSNGVCLAADELNIQGGEECNVPIDPNQVIKVWNNRRADRNTYDDSGPAKLRVTLANNGRESTFTLPVQMDLHGLSDRKLIGSDNFRWRDRGE